jgi:hypothetical protein
LLTFESDFELIQDFRSVNFQNSTLRRVDNQPVIFDVYTTSKEILTWTIDDPDNMLSGVTSTETAVTIQVKPNVSGFEKIASIVSNNLDIITIIQDA